MGLGPKKFQNRYTTIAYLTHWQHHRIPPIDTALDINPHLLSVTTTLSQPQTADKATVDSKRQAIDITSTMLHRHHIHSDHKQDQTK